MKKNKILIFSLIINIIFLLGVSVFIVKKGGIGYIAQKTETVFDDKNVQSSNQVYNIKLSNFNAIKPKQNDIMFLGDSITQFAEWDELLNNNNIQNRGIMGDTTDGLLDRLNEVVSCHPKKIFLMIGINDLQANKSDTYVENNYNKILELLKDKLPNTKIYVESILPIDESRIQAKNKDVQTIDKNLKSLSTKFGDTYVNLYSLFVNSHNELKNKYTPDGIHLYGNAYEIWINKIQRYIQQ